MLNVGVEYKGEEQEEKVKMGWEQVEWEGWELDFCFVKQGYILRKKMGGHHRRIEY